MTYTYDTAGRRTSMTVSGQAPVSYTYDANARLRTITQAPLNPVAIDYDAANRRALLTLPNGVSTEYQYDGASRLTALIYRNTLGLLGDLQYGYDAAGNRTSVGGSFARALLPEAVSTSSYDAGNRQLAFGPSTMTFDDNGNLLTRTDGSGTTTYSWDARNRLSGITSPSVSGTFAYDGLGRRAQKTIGGATSAFLYDGLDMVKETSGGNDVLYLRTLNIDEALARTDSVDTVHSLADALGSSVALTNTAGAAGTIYTYEPFGRTEVTGTPNPNSFRFTGREDDGTGLYYYRARYYDPGRGRFVSQDPIGLRGGINLFAYVHNSPTIGIDPEGLIEPGSQGHHPPGWNENWDWRQGSREGSGKHWWDPDGGEWRWHQPDKHHPKGEWDYNPWKTWNDEWRHVPGEPPLPEPVAPIPWWQRVPSRIPGPFLLIINWCDVYPELNLPGCSCQGPGA